MLGFTKSDILLTFNFFRMSVRDRYAGSSLGGFWAIANPLFMLAVYTLVFGFVFKVRIPGAETTLAYVIWLISGYGPWLATVEAVSASTVSVVGAAGMVKNLAFKVELIPISAAFVGLISLSVTLIFLLALLLWSGNAPDWRIIWLPIIVAVQFFLIIALGLWFSAFNVFVRDFSVALPNLLTIWMFATPIFYPVQSVPRFMQILTLGNPFFLISEAYRSVLISHQTPNLLGLLYVFTLAVVIFLGGLKTFRRVKGFFDAAL